MADTLLPADAGQPEARRATCSRCGAELRHPDSVDAGIGPVCKAKRARETTELIARQLAEVDLGARAGLLPGIEVGPLEVINPVPPSRLR